MRGIVKAAARPVLIAVVGALVFLGWSLLKFGSLARAFAYINGNSVIAESSTVAAGDVACGEIGAVAFRLWNYASTPVTVVGVKAGCSCTVADHLPLRLASGEANEFRLRFSTRGSHVGDDIQHGVLLYVDVDHPPIYLTVTAHVVSAKDDSLSDQQKSAGDSSR